MTLNSRVVILLSLVAWMVNTATAKTKGGDSPQPARLNELVESSCLGCHDGDSAEGGLDLATLSNDLQDPNIVAKWVRMIDRVADGEMPPESEGFESADRKSFVRSASKWIGDSERHRYRSVGRVVGRRLSNVQLERTLQDLLGIGAPLAKWMPAEPRSEGFYGIANAQSMSHFHLQSHLQVVDTAIDIAFDRLVDQKADWHRDFTPHDLCEARRRRGKRCREPEMRQGVAIVWACTLPFYGRIAPTKVPESGWYRITISATALKPPQDHGVWCTVRTGPCTAAAPLLNDVGSFEAGDSPDVRTLDAWIEQNHMLEIRPADVTLKKGKFPGGQVGIKEGESQGISGVAIHRLTMKRIFPNGDREQVHKNVLGEMKITVDRKRQTIKLRSKMPIKETVGQLQRFIVRAFRRPVTNAEMKPYVKILRQALSDGDDPIDALRSTYRAVLCSPRFLYFVEPIIEQSNGNSSNNSDPTLESFAIANRLSYLLTGSMPDERLMQLARAGKLTDAKVLEMQVDRLLKGDRGMKFSRDFTSQWLDLIDINFTEPDRRMYGKFDLVVQNAMLQETHHFFHSLLKNNARVERLIRSNFTFLNSRLARFYQLDLDVGEQTTRVKLPKDSVRGGLLSQGAIMKVTANGTTTSPVLRGVWVSERILGIEIPPPPESVPSVEPDTRGAVTIREQLLKHVAHESCAACHKNIDPPGYALENFDPAGQWRDRYFYRNAKRKKRRPKIDPSFTTRDGQKFNSFNAYRDLVCRDPDALARNFAAKILVCGTGAKIGFADRESLDAITKKSKNDHHGLRSIIKAVVTSPTFLSK